MTEASAWQVSNSRKKHQCPKMRDAISVTFSCFTFVNLVGNLYFCMQFFCESTFHWEFFAVSQNTSQSNCFQLLVVQNMLGESRKGYISNWSLFVFRTFNSWTMSFLQWDLILNLQTKWMRKRKQCCCHFVACFLLALHSETKSAAPGYLEKTLKRWCHNKREKKSHPAFCRFATFARKSPNTCWETPISSNIFQKIQFTAIIYHQTTNLVVWQTVSPSLTLEGALLWFATPF